ncbi:uncharacterized protein LOC135487604 [Lineus longissimus]|uniref:uncharacterized protein LOC135487604 n=1 Tax=Lineus longissimus TaxID=88925 RepID=UPI00315D54BE
MVSDYKESSSDELLEQALLPSFLSRLSGEGTRRSSVPVHLPSEKQEEHHNEIKRPHHSTVYGALASIYGTSGLIQQKAAIIPSVVLENSDGSVKELDHSGEIKSSFEGKKRSSYGSMTGFKPATHLTEHVVDYKIGPGIGAFEVAKGRISKENFELIKDTVAKMDRVVAEFKQTAVKFRSEVQLSVGQAPNGTSKINTIGQVCRNSTSSLINQDNQPENEWYAGKGSVRNLVDDYEEMEEQAVKEAGVIGKYRYPVCGILARKSSQSRMSHGEVESDQRWSNEEDRQLRYQKKVSDAREEKRRASIDIATQTIKMHNTVRDDYHVQQTSHFPQTGSDSLLERKVQRQGIKSQMVNYTRTYGNSEEEENRQYKVVGPRMVSAGSNTDRSSFEDGNLQVSRMQMKNKRDVEIEDFVESVPESAVEEARSSLEKFYSATSVCARSNASADDLKGESIECHHGSFDTDEQTRPTPAASRIGSVRNKMEVTFSNDVLEEVYSDGAATTTESSTNASPESLASAETIKRHKDKESLARKLEIEEFYNDDVISQCMCKADHMRLQTTMSLDTSSPSRGNPVPFDDSSIVEKFQGDCETTTPLPTPIPSERIKKLLACSTPNRMIPHMVEISEVQDSSGNSEELSNRIIDAGGASDGESLAADESDGVSVDVDSDVEEPSLTADGDGDNPQVKDEIVQSMSGQVKTFV